MTMSTPSSARVMRWHSSARNIAGSVGFAKQIPRAIRPMSAYMARPTRFSNPSWRNRCSWTISCWLGSLDRVGAEDDCLRCDVECRQSLLEQGRCIGLAGIDAEFVGQLDALNEGALGAAEVIEDVPEAAAEQSVLTAVGRFEDSAEKDAERLVGLELQEWQQNGCRDLGALVGPEDSQWVQAPLGMRQIRDDSLCDGGGPSGVLPHLGVVDDDDLPTAIVEGSADPFEEN